MKQLIIFILLLFTLIGCSTIPVYDAEPLEEEIDYHQGRAITHKATEQFSSWTVYEKSTYNDLIFFVTVKNTSDKKILFSPESLYLTFNENNDILFPAHNPEKIIKEIKTLQASAEQYHNIATGLNLFFTATNIAVDIADENYEEIDDDVVVSAVIQHNENEEYSDKIWNLDNQLNYWQNDVLRKTTLYPDDEISGFVAFVYKRSEDKFKLNIPFENDLHSHRFALRKMN